MSLQSIRKNYTEWAPHYDATHAWTMPYRETARRALRIQPGDRVLDLACGTGLNLAPLHEIVGDNGSVLGVDLTPAMLDVACQRILDAGWKNVAVREADAAHLPFEEASFDHAICTYALNVIPDYVAAITEVKRALIRGGRLAVVDVNIPDRRSTRWLNALWQVCNVDISHRILEQLRLAFPQLHMQTYWFGLIFIAVGTKV